MSHLVKLSVRAAIACTVALTLTGTALAQAVLEEVTVTARKRTESLQSVPITVTAFTAEAIQRRGIRNIQDVANLTPGLSFDKGFAPQDTRPNIRGLPTTRGRPPIGVLLDGIDVSSESIATAGGSNLMNMKLVDVERIEVVKGPQSALYGRVAFGGAINYVSKRPDTENFEGNATLDVAQDGLYEVRGAVNFPLADGKMALRVNALYSQFDGFYDNAISGEALGGWDTKGVAAALRFTPNDTTDFTLRLSYSDDESEPRPSYYWGQAVPGRNTTLPLPANAVGLQLGQNAMNAPLPAFILYPSIGAAQGADQVLLSVDPLTGKDYVGSTTKTFIASFVGDIDFGWGKLSSWTGIVNAEALSRADSDFFAAPAANVLFPSPGLAEPLPAAQVSDLDSDIKQFSQELRLGKLDGEGFRWAVGALYWQEDYDSVNASQFINGFSRSVPIAGPTFPQPWSAARETQVRGPFAGELNARNTKHNSGYVIAEYDITSKLEISGEFRYAQEDYDYIFGRSIGLSVSPTGVVGPATPVGVVGTPSKGNTYSAPKFTLNYKPSEDALVFLTASKGVKPGGFLNVGVVLDVDDAFYRPEILWNYEAGFKSSWLENRLRFNASVFHMIYEDRINTQLVPDLRSPQGTSTLVVNQGEAKVDGLEVEITSALSESLTLSMAYTYLDPRFTESDVPNTSALGIAGSGNCRLGTVGQQTVCFTNTNGNQMEQSNKHAFVSTLAYRRDLTNGWRLNSDLAFQKRSKRYTSPDNLVYLPAYTQVDARVGVENDRYNVLLYVNNLLDDDTVRSSQSYGDPFIAFPVFPPVLAYTTYPADPRQVGVRLNIRF